MRVADSGGEEFEEAIGGFLPAGRDDGRNATGDEGRELVHAVSALAGSNGTFA